MPSTVSGRERSERAPLASTGVATDSPMMPSTVSGRERSERAPLASTGVATDSPCAPSTGVATGAPFVPLAPPF